MEHEGASITAVRGTVPGAYSWLYKHDREWLSAHRPPPALRSRQRKRQSHGRGDRGGATSVDWAGRDTALSRQVRVAANDIKWQEGRPVRVSVTALSRKIGRDGVLTRWLRKLPLTARAIEEVVEAHEQCALRKLTWAAALYQREGLAPTRGQLVKRAGIGRYAHVRSVRDSLDAAVEGLRLASGQSEYGASAR